MAEELEWDSASVAVLSLLQSSAVFERIITTVLGHLHISGKPTG